MMVMNVRLALAVMFLSVLAGCGGGGSEDAAAVEAGGQLRGTVVGIEGAQVFLDLNNNLELDSGEPVGVSSGHDGRFSLPVTHLNPGELAIATLVAEIPLHARDVADGGRTLAEAGRKGITLIAPASAYLLPGQQGLIVRGPAVISPLTGLVGAEVNFNGTPFDASVRDVQQALGLGGLDPMSDYIAQPDARLWRLARLAGVALGEYGEAAAGLREEDGAPITREQLRIALQLLRDNLPALEQQFAQAVGVAPIQTVAGSHIPPGPPRLQDGHVRYVVRLRASASDPQALASQIAAAHQGRVRFAYDTILRGFAMEVPQAAAAAFVDAMDSDPRVDRVEPDVLVTATQQTQALAPWSLDRIDQRALPLSLTYSYRNTGAGVRAYILDTGIRATHAEFMGRVADGFSAISDDQGTNDCQGHGTHVAGTVGGTTWGVAKGVTLVPVRVLGCDGSGYISGIVAGLDWAVEDARSRPAVVNMSLGGGVSQLLDSAVERAVRFSSMPVVVAAGNSNESACNASPARAALAITVGASTRGDSRASFSNFGTCVDLFAPGSVIPSAGITSDTATTYLSGTSMAAPHVTGYAARILERTPLATGPQVARTLVATASMGELTDVRDGSPNALLFARPNTHPISVRAPTPDMAVSVSALRAATWQRENGSWRGLVTIAVKNAAGQLVPGALVRGNFSVGGTDIECTTKANGTCPVYTGALGSTTPSTQFTITSVSSSSGLYDASANVRTSIVLSKP